MRGMDQKQGIDLVWPKFLIPSFLLISFEILIAKIVYCKCTSYLKIHLKLLIV